MSASNPDAAPNVPPDMHTAAVAMHEYFTTMVDAGFTSSQSAVSDCSDGQRRPEASPRATRMSPPTITERIHGLADLAREPHPNLAGQSELGIATAEVHLTKLAREQGATWADIAKLHGPHTNPKAVKAYIHKLEIAVRHQLVLRQNAN